MSSETVDLYKRIQNYILAQTAEVITYTHWESEFAVKNLREIPSRIKEVGGFVPIDPNELTKEELEDLGFRLWSEENPFYLIPLWVYPYLVDELQTQCIDGTSAVMKRDEMDTDNRMGMLAFGVYPKESA